MTDEVQMTTKQFQGIIRLSLGMNGQSVMRDLFGLILLMWIGDSRHNRKEIGD